MQAGIRAVPGLKAENLRPVATNGCRGRSIEITKGPSWVMCAAVSAAVARLLWRLLPGGSQKWPIIITPLSR